MLELLLEEKIKNRSPINLHLGCGPFILDNYINIDGEYLKDTPGIFTFDISCNNYPVPDDCVDEILSVHVIEHIERWYIDGMLKEWYRILKPGGIVAIEWPDLLKTCQSIVKDPACLLEENKKLSKQTINAIYGNWKFKHRAMMHAYGYSIESLTKILLNNNFKNIEIEENIYRKTINDSRIIARK